MKSIAIFQKYNGQNCRLVDGLYTSIENGLKAYDRYPGEGITFLWNCINDLPDAIEDGENITNSDIAAMYERESTWTDTKTLKRIAQETVDNGDIGFYHGIRIVKPYDDEEVYDAYRFLIEIRHLHE